MAVAAAQNDVSSVIAAINGAGGSGSSGAMKEVEDRFLKLLVTQLKNQDPMNPMENAEMTMQLAQMSTVEGINKLNANMESLLAGYQAAQTLQATALLGHQVLTDGNVMTLVDGQAVGAAELAKAADKVTVKVLGNGGQVLDTLEMGPQAAGEIRFGWDGTDSSGNALPNGQYRFEVNAVSGGSAVAAVPLSLVPVSSVRMQGGNVSLELAGIGQRTLDQVRQVFN
jgi:flagellar basal-body rod modification protein FlgD